MTNPLAREYFSQFADDPRRMDGNGVADAAFNALKAGFGANIGEPRGPLGGLRLQGRASSASWPSRKLR